VEQRYLPYGGQEAETVIEEEGKGQDMPFKSITPVIYFLQLGPTSQNFCHLLKMPSDCESITGLIH
jgi:hypothetical protein